MSNHQQPTERQSLPTLAFPSEEQRRLQNQELLAITRRTQADKIRDGMGERLVPVGEPPLTSWKTYPTDKKFPVIPAKEGTFHFTRKRIGEDLFPPQENRNHPFDISDPYIRETPIGYESMNDPNLKEYYENNPEIRERLACDGLLEWPGGGVKASMKDWNKYRSYLGRLQIPALDKGFQRAAELKKLELDQLRNIKIEDNRELRKIRDEKRKEYMDALRNERKAKLVYAQLKSDSDARLRLCERAKELAIHFAKREVTRQKVRERLSMLKKAERKRAKRILLDWYCRQLYADVMKKAIAGHRKAQRDADLDNFVGTKRELQEQKQKYLSCLQARRDAEQECLVRKRIAKYEALALKVKQGQKKDTRTKEQRDLDFVRKFAMRWLNIARSRMQQREAYNDSVWRVRTQLIEMVSGLKKKTGKVSFAGFIKGLVKLKPGKENVPDMTDEVREIMNYILDILIKAAFDTYRKHYHPCANAYDKQANRRRILGQPDCDPKNMIPPELMTKARVKPKVPFDFPEFDCAREIEKAAEAVKAKASGESRRCTCKKHLGIKSPCQEREKPKKDEKCDSIDSSCIAERINRAVLKKASRHVCAEGPEGEPCQGSEPKSESRKSKTVAKRRIKTPPRSANRDSENSSDIAEKISRMALKKASRKICAEGPEGEECRRSLREEGRKKTPRRGAARQAREIPPSPVEDGGSENSSEAAERLSRSALQKASHQAVAEGGSKRPGKGVPPRTKSDEGRNVNASDFAQHLSKAAIKSASAGATKAVASIPSATKAVSSIPSATKEVAFSPQAKIDAAFSPPPTIDVAFSPPPPPMIDVAFNPPAKIDADFSPPPTIDVTFSPPPPPEIDVAFNPPATIDAAFSPPPTIDVAFSPPPPPKIDVAFSPPAKIDVSSPPPPPMIDVAFNPPAKVAADFNPPPTIDVAFSPPPPPTIDVAFSPPAKIDVAFSPPPPMIDVAFNPPAKIDVSFSPPAKIDVAFSPPPPPKVDVAFSPPAKVDVASPPPPPMIDVAFNPPAKIDVAFSPPPKIDVAFSPPPPPKVDVAFSPPANIDVASPPPPPMIDVVFSPPPTIDAAFSPPPTIDVAFSPPPPPKIDVAFSPPAKIDVASSPPPPMIDVAFSPPAKIDVAFSPPTKIDVAFSPPPPPTIDVAFSPPANTDVVFSPPPTIDVSSSPPAEIDVAFSPPPTIDVAFSPPAKIDVDFSSSPPPTIDVAFSPPAKIDVAFSPPATEDDGSSPPGTTGESSTPPGTMSDESRAPSPQTLDGDGKYYEDVVETFSRTLLEALTRPSTEGESSDSSAVANRISAEALKRALDDLCNPDTQSENSSIIAEKLGKKALREALERLCGIKPDTDESYGHCLPDDLSETSSQLAEKLSRIALHHAIERICGGEEPNTNESYHHCLPDDRSETSSQLAEKLTRIAVHYAIEKICGGKEPNTNESYHHCLRDARADDTSSETSSTLAEKFSHIAIQKALNRICTDKLNPDKGIPYDGGDVGNLAKLGNNKLEKPGFR